MKDEDETLVFCRFKRRRKGIKIKEQGGGNITTDRMPIRVGRRGGGRRKGGRSYSKGDWRSFVEETSKFRRAFSVLNHAFVVVKLAAKGEGEEEERREGRVRVLPVAGTHMERDVRERADAFRVQRKKK